MRRCRCSPVGRRQAPEPPAKERELLRETRTRREKASLRGTPGPILSSSDCLCSLRTDQRPARPDQPDRRRRLCCAQAPPERKGSGDVPPIPRASLTLIAFGGEFSNSQSRWTICGCNIGSYFCTMTQHFFDGENSYHFASTHAIKRKAGRLNRLLAYLW